MPVGLTDELVPLGPFPLLDDNNLKGGLQTVADTTARDAIPAVNRKEGMFVYTIATSETWVLGAGLGNGDWILYSATANAHAATHAPGSGDPLSTAAPTTGIGGGNAVGTGISFARNDHNHALRTTNGPTDLIIGSIADGEYVRRSGTNLIGQAISVNIAKLYPMALGRTIVDSNVEVVVGGIYFDPTLFSTPTVALRFVADYTSTDSNSEARLRLYDMGPGTGAFSPVRLATATITYANVGQRIRVDQALTLVASPGVDSNQIYNVARAYELRIYFQSLEDSENALTLSWGGFSVT